MKIIHLTRELNYIDLFLLVIFGLLRCNPNVPPDQDAQIKEIDSRVGCLSLCNSIHHCWLLVIVQFNTPFYGCERLNARPG